MKYTLLVLYFGASSILFSASDIAQTIMRELNIQYFYGIEKQLAAYPEEKASELRGKCADITARLNSIYAAFLDEKFTEEELGMIHDFVSSETGAKFHAFLNFRGTEGEQLRRVVDQLISSIYDEVHTLPAENSE